jgi:hypothetical protein
MLMDFTIGRRGFASYLKAVAGSNIVKTDFLHLFCAES